MKILFRDFHPYIIRAHPFSTHLQSLLNLVSVGEFNIIEVVGSVFSSISCRIALKHSKKILHIPLYVEVGSWIRLHIRFLQDCLETARRNLSHTFDFWGYWIRFLIRFLQDCLISRVTSTCIVFFGGGGG